jgi:hypothetical protein
MLQPAARKSEKSWKTAAPSKGTSSEPANQQRTKHEPQHEPGVNNEGATSEPRFSW